MLEAVGISNPGCVRTNNEDYYLLAPTLGLYMVADGMGGAQGGEHASKLAVETVAEYVWKSGRTDEGVLLEAFEEANSQVMNAAKTDASLEGMGTTLTAALEVGDEVLIANVGDSRAYVIDEGGELAVITEDQTWVNEVGRRLGIEEANLKTHPMRHVLTMAIGVSAPLRINMYRMTPTPGSQILLCSDGLHGVVEPELIEQTMRGADDPEAKCNILIEAARQAGGPDNITAVILTTTLNGS